MDVFSKHIFYPFSRVFFPLFIIQRAKKLENHTAPSHPPSTIKKIGSTEPGKPMYPKFTQRIRLHWDKTSPTQVSGGIRPQFQFGHPEQSRGLTVRERCRIQSFPDDFVIFGGTVQGRVQTGNAVPPLLAKAIAIRVKKALLKSS
ncbi:DNA cytosine methyltransferase [Patescibacteria group bacterium]